MEVQKSSADELLDDLFGIIKTKKDYRAQSVDQMKAKTLIVLKIFLLLTPPFFISSVVLFTLAD